jgi:transcriptional regulator with XRE-family HTH domain
MTLYRALLSASGLSQREVADFHGVRLDTVKNWVQSKSAPPDGVIAEIKGLVRRQLKAAAEMAAAIEKSQAEAIEIGLASDDHEAQQPPLDWPCATAQLQAIGLAVAQTDKPVRIVPRGSTPATAGAADINEKGR